jgi:hypothetical protein
MASVNSNVRITIEVRIVLLSAGSSFITSGAAQGFTDFSGGSILCAARPTRSGYFQKPRSRFTRLKPSGQRYVSGVSGIKPRLVQPCVDSRVVRRKLPINRRIGSSSLIVRPCSKERWSILHMTWLRHHISVAQSLIATRIERPSASARPHH